MKPFYYFTHSLCLWPHANMRFFINVFNLPQSTQHQLKTLNNNNNAFLHIHTCQEPVHAGQLQTQPSPVGRGSRSKAASIKAG